MAQRAEKPALQLVLKRGEGHYAIVNMVNSTFKLFSKVTEIPSDT